MMVLIGTIGVLRYSGVRLPPRSRSAGFMRAGLSGVSERRCSMRPLPRATAIGLLTAFLPCGWLYMFRRRGDQYQQCLVGRGGDGGVLAGQCPAADAAGHQCPDAGQDRRDDVCH